MLFGSLDFKPGSDVREVSKKSRMMVGRSSVGGYRKMILSAHTTLGFKSLWQGN